LKKSDKVQPEFHGAVKDKDGNMEASAAAEIERRCQVLVGFVDKNDVAKKGKKGPLQPHYQPNASTLRDHDHMLKLSTACEGLVTFKPKIPVSALGPSERRFKCLPEHLPTELAETLGGRKFRSAIEDIGTGLTRNECGWKVYRQSEWSVLDQGSTGWPAKMVQIYHWSLRGAECPDPIHRRIRIWQNSATEAGLHFVKAEYEIVFGYFRAPFGSNANYNSGRAAFIQMHRSFTYQFYLFQALYPWIVFASCEGVMPPGFGTAEHQEEVWDRLPLANFLQNIGTMCARNRWLE